jgi:hypothetical protein
MPAVALFGGYWWSILTEWRARLSHSAEKSAAGIIEGILSVLLIIIFVGVLLLLKVGMYPTLRYYQRFWQLTTGQITKEEYRNAFDAYTADNSAAAEIIGKSGDRELLIWGTNPMLYAQTHTSPVGRFTVLFHIYDFKAEHETFLDFQRKEPQYVVWMKNAQMPQEMSVYLNERYMPNADFTHFTLWKKRTNGQSSAIMK